MEKYDEDYEVGTVVESDEIHAPGDSTESNAINFDHTSVINSLSDLNNSEATLTKLPHTNIADMSFNYSKQVSGSEEKEIEDSTSSAISTNPVTEINSTDPDFLEVTTQIYSSESDFPSFAKTTKTFESVTEYFTSLANAKSNASNVFKTDPFLIQGETTVNNTDLADDKPRRKKYLADKDSLIEKYETLEVLHKDTHIILSKNSGTPLRIIPKENIEVAQALPLVGAAPDSSTGESFQSVSERFYYCIIPKLEKNMIMF